MEECDSILRLIEIYEDDVFVYLVLEYQQQGSLLGQILKNREFEEKQVKIIMEQLLLALDFIHQKRIVHRDIKLDNVLINRIDEEEFNVKIADFGLACFFPEDSNGLTEKCGTPCYVAPEILRGEPYTTLCDMFSMGSLMFGLITGRYLFKGKDKQELLNNNKVCNLQRIDRFL